MKISKKILFITFFIICILTNMVFANTGKVKTQATRIREEANTTSAIITVIYENDEVEILGESGDWYKIKYKEYTGYVKKEFIKSNSTNSQNSSNKTNSNAIVSNTTNSSAPTSNTVSDQTVSDTPATDAVNNQTIITINSETYAKILPNFASNNVVKFEASKQVNKITEINNWVQVSDGVNTGWVLKNKLQEVRETPKEPEVDTKQNTVSNETNTTNTASNTISNTTNNTSKETNTTSSNVNKTAKITVETAKVREKASANSNVIGFLDYGDVVTLLDQDGDWYKINFENKTGYIKNTLFKVSNETVSSRSLTEERKDDEIKTEVQEETVNSSEVVNYAKQYLGYPYIVGGKNPNTGFDCSGFTRYVFLNFGYSLGSTAASQTSIGAEVSRENLEPGDLILFLNEEKSGIGHTGIYIGSGEFIHSANPQRGVVTDNMNSNSYYNERFVSARRIVNN